VVTSGGGGGSARWGVVDNRTNIPTVMGKVAGQLCPVGRVYLPAVAHAPKRGYAVAQRRDAVQRGKSGHDHVEYIPAAGNRGEVRRCAATREMRVEEDVLVSLLGWRR
jgi:hypothetical protein